RKYAIIIIFVVAAILTPPDVLSQIMLAVPLMGLYELSILLIRWTSPKHEPQTPKPA
ncbi:MAG TPA: twin-arginine translocase subunit TatC, partial [Alphaproteobacteria bacterium]|nr:twin-arginine translocase subunit TatC [Alphaproteobacteria bacterium]